MGLELGCAVEVSLNGSALLLARPLLAAGVS